MGSFASHSHRCRHVEQPRLGFAEKRSDGSPGTVVRGFWSIACQTLAAHEVSHAIAADRESFSEVDGFYWTVLAPDIVNSGREEQGSVSV